MDKYIEQFVYEIGEICDGQTEGRYIYLYIRSALEAVIAQLAVLRVGAICILLDRQVPLEYYLSRNIENIACMVTDNYESPIPTEFPIIHIRAIKDINHTQLITKGSTLKLTSQHAYCIMTSGTTGQPKAVLLRQESLLNQIDAKIQLLNLNQNSRVCLCMNLSFVASLWQIFATMFVGGTLVLLDERIRRSPYEIFKTSNEYQVNVLSVVPSVLQAYLTAITNKSRKVSLDCLSTIILTGELLPPFLISRYYLEYDIPIINAYGQTECSDDTFHFQIPKGFVTDETQVVPIGRPIPNIRYSIVDEQGNSVPQGEKGELCIAGICLADGYLGDAVRTKQAFRPLATLNGDIVFHTGDEVSLLADGTLVCYGRIDNQIKIHGFRIEPEAIEFCCLTYEGMRDALAIKVETVSGSYMQLEYVTQENTSINPQDLKSYLEQRLPVYMVPSVFTQVRQIDYHENGKKCRTVSLPTFQNADSNLYPNENMYKLIENIFQKTLSKQIDVSTCMENSVLDLLDSMEFISFVVAIEEALNIAFEDEKLVPEAFPKTEDLINYLLEKVAVNTDNSIT